MSNWKRFLFASDVHGGEQDAGANKALFTFMGQFKPDIRVMGGDLFDFAALRRKASEEERRISIREDFEAGRTWLAHFQPTHFLKGNHDERLWKLRDDQKGPISDYAGQLVEWVEEDCRKYKCPILPYDKRHGVLEIGHLKCLHGFTTGVHAARQTALVYGACIFGHGHGIQMASIAGLEDRTARMAGCLCNLDMEYAETSMGSLMWRHGWVYGVINDKTGNYLAIQAEEIDGHFLVSSDFKEI